jgi:hypothetical protein
LLGLLTYGSFVLFFKGSDIREHIYIFIREGYPSNFLYYFTIDAFTLFRRDVNNLLIAAVLILSISLVLKYIATLKFISLFDTITTPLITSANFKIALICIVVFAIPSAQFIAWGKYSSGQIVPNVWHNSTVMYLMPVAIINLYQLFSIISEQRYDIKSLAQFFATLLVSILIKPSYFFIISPTIFILVLTNIVKKKVFFPVILGGVFVIAQYFFIYGNESSYKNSEASGIGISFLTTWMGQLRNYWFMTIPAFVASTLFPTIHIIFNFRRLIANTYFKILLLLMFFGFIIFLFVIETGPRRFHGNFAWQLVVSYYFLFTFLVKDYFNQNIIINKNNSKVRLERLILNLHIFSGIIYIIRIAFFGLHK